jgi:hypothetical protein
VAVEKGTKAVISATFSVYSERTFNNLQWNFEVERLRKEFFNSDQLHVLFRSPLHYAQTIAISLFFFSGVPEFCGTRNLKNDVRLVGARGFEPRTHCAQGLAARRINDLRGRGWIGPE